MTNWEKPVWYLTPQEFADIVVDSLVENNYFRRDEKAHPEDIEAAFSTTATAVARAISTMGRKISEEEKSKKLAMMQAKDLAKNNSSTITLTSSSATSPSSISYGDKGDYSEDKYGKIFK